MSFEMKFLIGIKDDMVSGRWHSKWKWNLFV